MMYLRVNFNRKLCQTFVSICFCVCIIEYFVERVTCHEKDSAFQLPTVVIAVLARNKAHTLPHYLGYLEQLDYPKSRIALWIRSDHNIDDTSNILNLWIRFHGSEYHSIDVSIDNTSNHKFDDETGVFDWSPRRYDNIIKLRENAMKSSRAIWADFIWFLDCDIFVVNKNTLHHLLRENKTIIAPLVESLGAYSNYWCGMNEMGYYKRTEDYIPILEREKVGCFKVPMVHSAVLIDLRRSSSLGLTFEPSKLTDYTGPRDDIIAFANSAKALGIGMHVLNTEQFGFMLAPSDKSYTLHDDNYQLTNLKVDMIVESSPMIASPTVAHFVPKIQSDKLGLDEVYLINLDRRHLRRQKMLAALAEIGIETKILTAVDGKKLDDKALEEMGIKMMPEYLDPYSKRPLTKGEIGCFMSHYNIWKDMVAKQHRMVLVFEDDLRFEPYFKKKVLNLLTESQKIGMLWDLIYLGRKRLSVDSEPYVRGSTNFVHAGYSYWTLCYLITIEGAKKLIGANPLGKMVPVDEYLPIMFDMHPESVWKNHFPKRNLRAFSANPLLVYPTHYTGEPNYISDTEDSEPVLAAQLKDEL